jgi:hypothetical protein
MAHGEAYAFFEYLGKQDDLEKELPTMRRLAQTPSQLELVLKKTDALRTGVILDTELLKMADYAKEDHMEYVLHARQENTPNKVVSGRLGNLMNMLYASPLYERAESFSAEVVHKEGNKYVLLKED